MCGIAGYFTRSPHDAQMGLRMASQIRHRGPDDEGYAVFGSGGSSLVLGGEDTPESVFSSSLSFAPKGKIQRCVAEGITVSLAHRRLAIVDLSAGGHQPMSTSDGRYWIVFNGEVYNHLELRSALQAEGCRFHTRTDTEVVLCAYLKWGAGCLERFRGMFAFLVFDTKKRRVFAARDPFGIKPLYYWVSEQGIAFASEIKQFTVLPGWQARVNGQRAYDFLTWGMLDHTNETLFSGVFQVRGGQCLTLDLVASSGGSGWPQAGSQLPGEVWYQPGTRHADGLLEQSEGAGFHERFMESIALHLRADVPVGSCLSGGLDSSAVVCAVRALLEKRPGATAQRTFSACAHEARFDERPWVDAVVKHTGVEAHYVYPDVESLFGQLDSMTWHQDEPFGSASIYYQWQVFGSAAAKGVKVLLDGQGADEVLAGYHPFFAPFLVGLLQRGAFAAFWREAKAIRKVHGYSWAHQLQRVANVMLPEPARQLLRATVGKSAAATTLLNMDLLGATAIDPSVALGAKARSIRGYSIAQIAALNLPMLLHYEDRNSMAHSVEARVPFLDPPLVEWGLALPDEQKIRKGVTKWVMREGLKDLLPEAVLGRMDKMGFVTPEELWLREQGTDAFRGAFAEALEASQGIFSAKAPLLLDETISGQRTFSFEIWRIISFGSWMRCFQVTL